MIEYLLCRCYSIIMRTEHYRARDLTTLLRKQKIATMTELKDVLGSAADITIFRKLAELSYQTSYSHRGRYYTLADIPQYDAWGLWSYRSVWFSRRGTLLATAEALVQEADAGFFVAELEGVLNVEVKGALLRLVRQQKLARASFAGRYLYCSPDTATRDAQLTRRPHSGGGCRTSMSSPMSSRHRLFYPYPKTLTYSENLLGIAVLTAPVQWLTGNPVLGYNVAFLFSYVLAGSGMYLLAVSITGNRLAAVVSGVAFAFLPYRVAQLPHLQMLMFGWMPIGLWALHRFFRSGSRVCTGDFRGRVSAPGTIQPLFPLLLHTPGRVGHRLRAYSATAVLGSARGGTSGSLSSHPAGACAGRPCLLRSALRLRVGAHA